MTPERWQQVDKLLGQALAREPEERSTFLDEACQGDLALRSEVDSLLSAHKKAGDFIEAGPLKTENATPGTRPTLSGRKVGHYQVLSELGRGGMGKVYKARDTVLDRTVALKILPPELANDPERKRRFLQEAKAASALNHPNIVTVYDILAEEGVDLIVMEYVQGKTLDQLTPRHGLKLTEVMKYGVQLADALAKAHAAGIVHRDLKPSNLMVTEQGALKVVDFGLAKFATKAGIGLMSSLQAQQADSVVGTEEGLVLGTVPYMSPEQAEGKAVDARSDIFSFGAVLYEMATGRRAFQGDSSLATLTAVLRQEPRPASEVVRGIPSELDRIIERCLRKDPERRFQSAADLKVVLQELKEGLESGSLIPESAAISGKPTRAASQLRWMAFGLVVVSLAVAGWFWLGPSETAQPEASLTVVPLTSYPGWEYSPSFSPDGNQVAFAWGKTGHENDADIYIKQIGVEEPFRLTDNPAPDVNPAWSPDNRSIAFGRYLSPQRIAYLMKPQRGGPERTIAEFYVAGDSNVVFAFPANCAWTPSSKSLVVVGKNAPEASDALFLISLETLEKRQLTHPPPGLVDSDPEVSADGRALVFKRSQYAFRVDLYRLNLSEDLKPQGDPVRLTFDNRWSESPAWTLDGRDIMFISGSTAFDLSLWRMGPSKLGQPSRLAFAGGRVFRGLSLSRQGARLAYSVWRGDTNILRVEVPGPGRESREPMKLIASTQSDAEPAYSPDGKRIAFRSYRSGSPEIWVCNSDGSDLEQLSAFGGPATNRPRWCPSGEQIVFYSDAKGNRDIYVIRADGGVPNQLTKHPSVDTNPGWSADGKWIYFQSDRSGQMQVWKVPVDGGEAAPVWKIGEGSPVESPDGKFLYYDKGGPDNYSVWRVPTNGGAETQIVDSLRPVGGWVVVDNGVYFISRPDEKGVSHIRFKDLANGSVRSIAPIKGPVYYGLAVSPNRRSFLYTEFDESGSDLMLVENFR